MVTSGRRAAQTLSAMPETGQLTGDTKPSRSANNGVLFVPALAGSVLVTRPASPRPWGPAEVEAIVEPAVTADEAAERIVAFRSALPLALAGR
jgi:hypothetical protein